MKEKKPYYTKTKNGTRLDIIEFNGGLLGKVFVNKTGVCTDSRVFKDVDGEKVTIEQIEKYFHFL